MDCRERLMRETSNLGLVSAECCVAVICRGKQKMEEKVVLCCQLVDKGWTKLAVYNETLRLVRHKSQ